MNSSSHNCTIDMRLEWRLGEIYAGVAWFDKFCCGIWDWCVYAILDEFGSFTLIGFYDGSLVWTIVVRKSR